MSLLLASLVAVSGGDGGCSGRNCAFARFVRRVVRNAGSADRDRVRERSLLGDNTGGLSNIEVLKPCGVAEIRGGGIPSEDMMAAVVLGP